MPALTRFFARLPATHAHARRVLAEQYTQADLAWFRSPIGGRS